MALPVRLVSADAVPLAAFVLVGALLATLPAWAAARREPATATTASSAPRFPARTVP